MSVRTRWLDNLNVARGWQAIWRQRYIWHPTPHNKFKLRQWQRKVAEAERVLKRHPAQPEKRPGTGIDVSNNNGRIDFKKVKAAGEDFVYVKAGEGDWRDPTFVDNVKRAVAAGLHVGGYQFLRPRAGRSGATEAKWFITRLQSVGLKNDDLRPVLDVEVTSLSKSATALYVGEFIEEMRRQGYHPMIYTGTWFWEPHVGDKDFNAPLWWAGYVPESKIDVPEAWKNEGWTVWQYTDDAKVSGVFGGVDRNRVKDLNDIIV